MYNFLFNAQGDVIGLVDNMGNFQASYTYDAWGKVLSVKDKNGNEITDPNHIANINPIRYRGYYYDTETGFYYLQSRYYDPTVGRFINADGQLNTDSLLGYNMFAYCENNPINMVDYTGHNPVLSRGSRGFWVKELQTMLNTVGRYDLNVDGSFGPLTRNAVMAYQKANGLKVDGIVGPQTWRSLDSKFHVILASRNGKNGQPFNDLPRDPDVLDEMYKNTPPGAQRNKIKEQQKRVGSRNKQKRESNKIEIYSSDPVIVSIPSRSWWEDVSDWFDSLFRSCSGGVNEFGIPNTCFTSDTLIKTDNGLVPIIDIKVGDMVYSYEPNLEKACYKRVSELFSNTSSQMVHITIDGEVIKTTPEHPFYIANIGWVRAGDIKSGDEVTLSSGYILCVQNVKKFDLRNLVEVYNFEVEDYHTYFVSEIEVLVHNRCR